MKTENPYSQEDKSEKTSQDGDKKSIGKFIFVAGVFFGILLLLGVITGYFVYIKLYLPGKANSFFDHKQPEFKDVQDNLNKLSDDSNSNLSSYFDIENVSQLKDSDIEMSVNLAENVSQSAGDSLADYPKPDDTVKDIYDKNKKFLENVKKLGQDYQEEMTFIKAVKKVSDEGNKILSDASSRLTNGEYDKASDYDDAALYLKARSQEEQKLRDDFSRLHFSDKSAGVRASVIEFTDHIIEYLESTASAYEGYKNAFETKSVTLENKAHANENAAIAKFNKDIKKFFNDFFLLRRDKFLR